MASLGCNICMGASTCTTQVRLECNHQFHISCIRQWANGQNSFSCPMCRAESSISSNRYLTGFFLPSFIDEMHKANMITNYFENLEEDFAKDTCGPISENDTILLNLFFDINDLENVELSDIENDIKYIIVDRYNPGTMYYASFTVIDDDIIQFNEIDTVYIPRRKTREASCIPYTAYYQGNPRYMNRENIFQICIPC